jgi:hypothetical protein
MYHLALQATGSAVTSQCAFSFAELHLVRNPILSFIHALAVAACERATTICKQHITVVSPTRR